MRITLIENFRAAFYAPFYAASALGAYRDERLDVTLKSSTEAAVTIQTLLAGEGDVSWGGPTRLMAGLAANPASGLIVFCEVVGHDPFFLVGREANPHFSLRDLEGRTLAVVAEVPTPGMCLEYDLRLAGISLSSLVKAPARPMEENVAALREGSLDVIQVFQPYVESLVREGRGHIWQSAAQRGPTAYTTLNTTKAFASRHPEVLHGMTRAMYRTQRWIESHSGSELAQAVRAFFPHVPLELLAAAYDRYKALGVWNRSPVASRQGFEWLREAALSNRRLVKKFEYEDCVDMRFAQQAVQGDPPPL